MLIFNRAISALKPIELLSLLMLVLSVAACQSSGGKDIPNVNFQLEASSTTIGDLIDETGDDVVAVIEKHHRKIYVMSRYAEDIKTHLNAKGSGFSIWTITNGTKELPYQIFLMADTQKIRNDIGRFDYKEKTVILKNRTCHTLTTEAGVCINIKKLKTGKFTRSIKTPEGGMTTCKKLKNAYCEAIVKEVTMTSWSEKGCQGNSQEETFKLLVCAHDDT